MQKRQFGRSGPDVAVIGQGTWNIDRGGGARALAALRRGLDLGMTHIDCAEMYGAGAAEQLVGRAIAGRRDEVFLVSKVLPGHASRAGVIGACNRSLKRLGTDYLDCYLLHWRGAYPLAETLGGFEQLRSQGKIRSWGVSNFDVSDLEELVSLAGHQLPACNQVLYHLEERSIENAVLPWCEQHGIAVVGYSPFGNQGSLPGPRSARGRLLRRIADAHRATIHQVALRFLVRLPALFSIPKAANADHAAENAAASDVQLSTAEIGQLELAFPLDTRRRELPML